MNLLGKDISTQALLARIGAKLSARGLTPKAEGPIRFDGVEPRVDPLAFNLEAMAEHADAPARCLWSRTAQAWGARWCGRNGPSGRPVRC